MIALMLAAGIGKRLYGEGETEPPKALLEFEGKTLLERHVDILRACGVDELVMVLGYRNEEIEAEIARIDADGFVRTLFNADFHDGPILSFWTARELLTSGEDIVFMDADVLYPPQLMARLIEAPEPNAFLFDQAIELGEDPVRLCLRAGHVVEFGKMIEGEFDAVGEWPGFMKMSGGIAAKVAAAAGRRIEAGEIDATYEVAMRDVLLDEAAGTFGWTDISDIPWIEIDFPSDLLRARERIIMQVAAVDQGDGDEISETPRRAEGVSGE